MFQTPAEQPIRQYTALADVGDLDGARKIHSTLEPHRRAFQKWMRDRWLTNMAGAVPDAELKTWLALMGLPQGPVRLPLVPLSVERTEEMSLDLADLGLLASISS